MNGPKSHKEQALIVAQDETSTRRGRQKDVSRCRAPQGRGRQSGDKAIMECYYCHESQGSKAYYVETSEETVSFMAQLSMDKKPDAQDMWFIDWGYHNHMTLERKGSLTFFSNNWGK